MKKFQIIIKDLETGEELKNIKTNCIIGAVQREDEEHTETMTIVNCSGMQIEIAFAELEKLKKETRKRMILDAFSREDSPVDKLIQELLKGRE